MRIIKPSATLMEHNVTPYKFIEKVGRTCYKSEDLITDDSAEKFVKGLVNRQHWAMLEHETIFLVVSRIFMEDFLYDTQEHTNALRFFNITFERNICIISGSFRSFHDLFVAGIDSKAVVYMESFLRKNYPLVFGDFDDNILLNYFEKDCALYSRKEFIGTFKNRWDILSRHLTHTFLFVCDRGVSHEFVRHRVASFAQESTRYCNYSKDKFGNEITVIEPCFWNKNSAEYGEWKSSCKQSERTYFNMITLGNATPQEARTVLPNSLKTELIITATEEEWQHIVNLRYLGTTGAPHPQMKESMSFIIEDLISVTDGRVNVLVKGAK